MHVKIKFISVIPILLLPFSIYADVIVGPGAIVGPINVTIDNTFIVGSTTVTSTGTNAGSNVTGSILTLDSLLGPSPGQIIIQTLNGNALNANGGNINASHNVHLQTVGGHAVLANGAASTVTLTNTSIQTTGTGAGLVAIGGTINATGVTINNLGNSTVNVSAGHGAIAESGGTITLNAGTNITTGAFNSVGLGASGNGSQILTTSNIPLVMNGRGAMAVYLHDGGQVHLVDNSTLQLNASNSVGVTADNTTIASGVLGKGLKINFNATPSSGQAGGTGIVAINGGNVTLEDVTVQGVGAGAGAWAQENSTINLTGNSVIDVNSNAGPTFYTLTSPYLVTATGQISSTFSVTSGLPIGGLLSKGGTINSTGTTINVSANNGVGAYAAANTISTVNMFNNLINTTGISSFGIEAGENGRITGTNTNVTTTGGGAGLFLFAFNGYGSIDLTNSNVEALGANTTGLASLNLSTNLTNTATLTQSSLTSENDAVILSVGGPLSVNTYNSALTAQNGLLIDSQFNPSASQQSSVVLASSQSALKGDAHADSQSIINMSLSNTSFWSGASLDATNVTLDSTSSWSVTANSNITQQLSNNGLVSFTPPSTGFKTVTAQNYLGMGGTIAMNTYLAEDGSPSDLLVINGGSATGNTSLIVTNANGPGALTVANGILVIEALNGASTAPGSFHLGAPVIAGPFEYNLYRSSVDSTSENNWYLRSLCPPGNPQCSVEPPNPPIDPNIPSPNYRSEIGLYPILPAMALLYGQTLVDTLHQRIGQGKWPDEIASKANFTKRIWGRVIGLHGERERINNKRYIRSANYDYNFGLMQIGGDLFKREKENGQRDHIGVYGAFGRGVGKVQRPELYLGSNQFTALSAGGYWTLYSANEAYIDTVLQATRYYDASSQSYRLAPLKTDGWGFVGSIEAGYPFIIKPQWILEPQIQGIYETINLHDGKDIGSVIQFNNTEAVVGRIGARLAYKRLLDNDSKTLTTWFRPNLWHQFKGNPTAAFSSAYGFIPFQAQLEGTTLELNLGATLDLPKNLSIYANGSYGVGLNMHVTTYDGRVGCKVKL